MDNAELLKQLEKKIKEGNRGGALSNDRVAYNSWLQKNTGIKVGNDGKRTTVWKTGKNIGKPYDAKEGSKVFLTGYYGTPTPYKDLKYLRQAELTKHNISRLRRNKLRIGASKKDYKGNNIFLQEVDAREKKELKQLEELKKGTSFAGKTTNKNVEPFKKPELKPTYSQNKRGGSNELTLNNNKSKVVSDTDEPSNKVSLEPGKKYAMADTSKVKKTVKKKQEPHRFSWEKDLDAKDAKKLQNIRNVFGDYRNELNASKKAKGSEANRKKLTGPMNQHTAEMLGLL